MRILVVDKPSRDWPCEEQRRVFLELFGPEVEVTEELCYRHRHTFKPWGAVAWLYLSRVGYVIWANRWTQHEQQWMTDEQWDTYLGYQAKAFAAVFNEEGELDVSSNHR